MTQWQKENIAATPEFEEDIRNTQFSAADQEEVDQLNFEYQSDVDRYNSEVNDQLETLVDQMSRVDDEDSRSSLADRFSEETGFQLDDDLRSTVYGEADDLSRRRQEFENGQTLAIEEALSMEDFSPIREFYELNGIAEEEIANSEQDFFRQQTERKITEGQVLDSWKSSYTTEQFQASISELNIPDDQRVACARLQQVSNRSGGGYVLNIYDKPQRYKIKSTP